MGLNYIYKVFGSNIFFKINVIQPKNYSKNVLKCILTTLVHFNIKEKVE